MREYLIALPTMSEPEPLAAAKFWSIGYIDEVGTSSQFVGQKVEFRGEKWLVSMACEQVSLGNRVAGVKNTKSHMKQS